LANALRCPTRLPLTTQFRVNIQSGCYLTLPLRSYLCRVCLSFPLQPPRWLVVSLPLSRMLSSGCGDFQEPRRFLFLPSGSAIHKHGHNPHAGHVCIFVLFFFLGTIFFCNFLCASCLGRLHFPLLLLFHLHFPSISRALAARFLYFLLPWIPCTSLTQARSNLFFFLSSPILMVPLENRLTTLYTFSQCPYGMVFWCGFPRFTCFRASSYSQVIFFFFPSGTFSFFTSFSVPPPYRFFPFQAHLPLFFS